MRGWVNRPIIPSRRALIELRRGPEQGYEAHHVGVHRRRATMLPGAAVALARRHGTTDGHVPLSLLPRQPSTVSDRPTRPATRVAVLPNQRAGPLAGAEFGKDPDAAGRPAMVSLVADAVDVAAGGDGLGPARRQRSGPAKREEKSHKRSWQAPRVCRNKPSKKKKTGRDCVQCLHTLAARRAGTGRGWVASTAGRAAPHLRQPARGGATRDAAAVPDRPTTAPRPPSGRARTRPLPIRSVAPDRGAKQPAWRRRRLRRRRRRPPSRPRPRPARAGSSKATQKRVSTTHVWVAPHTPRRSPHNATCTRWQ